MAFDAHVNGAYTTVAAAPVPATSGTTMTLTTGTILPATPFTAQVWPKGEQWSVTNGEIVRVTGVTGDSITAMTRGYESSTPRTIVATDQFAVGPTAGQIRAIEQIPFSVGITIDGNGAQITTGLKGFVEVPFDATITSWDIFADQSGSVVVDVWKDVYANYPPVVGDSIAGSEKPTLSSATKNQDTNLTTWTGLTVTAGDVIGFNVDSATTVTRVHVIIKGTRR